MVWLKCFCKLPLTRKYEDHRQQQKFTFSIEARTPSTFELNWLLSCSRMGQIVCRFIYLPLKCIILVQTLVAIIIHNIVNFKSWTDCEAMSNCSHTFRIELSCRVFFVSYPSRRHRRVVLPDPANSDRFKSAKPSCMGSHYSNPC